MFQTTNQKCPVYVNISTISSWLSMCFIFLTCFRSLKSINLFNGKITGQSHISWENLWFPVNFPYFSPLMKGWAQDFRPGHPDTPRPELPSKARLSKSMPKARQGQAMTQSLVMTFTRPGVKIAMENGPKWPLIPDKATQIPDFR